jgi:hypothetical protein
LTFSAAGPSRSWMSCIFFIVVAFCYCAAQDSVVAAAALEKGAYDSVRASLGNRYANDTTDPEVCLAYAQSITDGVAARSLYKKIAAWKSAPDSIRAEAYYRLACSAFMAGTYRKARTYCESACSFSEKPQYAQFRSRPILQGFDDSITKTNAVSAAARTPNVRADSGKKSVMPLDKNGPAPGKGAFYLQVGAFAAIDNAQGLKNELCRRFSRVSVTAATSNGKNVYRVRVGAFAGKDAAQAFGDSALAKKGIPFRIVEE